MPKAFQSLVRTPRDYFTQQSVLISEPELLKNQHFVYYMCNNVLKIRNADMKIRIKENEFTFESVEEGKTSSPHTNRPLKWMEVSFRVSGDDVFEGTREISEVTTISDDGDEIAWYATELAHSYSQGNPYHDLTWQLSEKEVLAIETLVLADFELEPYRYKEEISQDCLYVSALVKLTSDEFEKLVAIYFGDIYFPVIRRGINESPNEMRFGKIIWSRNEGAIKFRIYLVDKKHDNQESSHLGLLEPDSANTKDMLATTIEEFNALLRTLEDKGVLTADEINAVKTVSGEKYNSRILEFARVNDVDKFDL
jgi:hypothetical protein